LWGTGIVAVSASEPNPLERARQLYQAQAPPPPLDRAYVDGNVLRFYVLVHDVQSCRSDECGLPPPCPPHCARALALTR
jgi:hypothetical protein